jgi:hypothetical protein
MPPDPDMGDSSTGGRRDSLNVVGNQGLERVNSAEMDQGGQENRMGNSTYGKHKIYSSTLYILRFIC